MRRMTVALVVGGMMAVAAVPAVAIAADTSVPARGVTTAVVDADDPPDWCQDPERWEERAGMREERGARMQQRREQHWQEMAEHAREGAQYGEGMMRGHRWGGNGPGGSGN